MNKKALFGIIMVILLPLLVTANTAVITPESVRTVPGANITINIYYNTGNTAREAACLLLEDAVEALDIDGDGTAGDIEIIVNDLTWSDYLNGMISGDQFTIYMLGWSPDYADPDDYIVPYLHGNYGSYSIFNNYKF